MYGVGPIAARGAFTGDFGISPEVPAERVPGEIERDREIMARRPGMLLKHVPIAVDRASGAVHCGGRYLFDRYVDAVEYRRWVLEEFVVDGVPFPERSYFVDPEFLAWEVIGAHDFAALHSHGAIRLERWSLARGGSRAHRHAEWVVVHQRALRAGLASVWLLYSEERGEVGLVTMAPRSPDAPGAAPDEASVGRLLELSIAEPVEGSWGPRHFDRAALVWSIWVPRAAPGSAPSLWPNSPPLPAPVPQPA